MRSIRDVLIVISLALVTIQTIHPMTHPGDAGAGDQLSPVSGCQPGSGPSHPCLINSQEWTLRGLTSGLTCPDWPIFISSHCVTRVIYRHRAYVKLSWCHVKTVMSPDMTIVISTKTSSDRRGDTTKIDSIDWFNMTTVISEARLFFHCYYH